MKRTKVFISQPMRGRTNGQIKAEREAIEKKLRTDIGKDIVIINSILQEDAPAGCNAPLWRLSESLKLLSRADVIYLAAGWKAARGCVIEYYAAQAYGIKIVEMK